MFVDEGFESVVESANPPPPVQQNSSVLRILCSFVEALRVLASTLRNRNLLLLTSPSTNPFDNLRSFFLRSSLLLSPRSSLLSFHLNTRLSSPLALASSSFSQSDHPPKVLLLVIEPKLLVSKAQERPQGRIQTVPSRCGYRREEEEWEIVQEWEVWE